MKARWAKRRELQQQLLDRTGCGCQHTGWPCPVCFHELQLPGITNEILHRMWEATLVLRGDYHNGQYGLDMPDHRLSATIDALLGALRGTVH